MSDDRFDSWLDAELDRLLAATSRRPAPRAPRYAEVPARGWRPLRLGAGAGAAVGAKLATGFVVAAFAIGVTGTALTGTPNPAAWGETVHQVVDQCKSLAQEEGIGGCVSAVAQQHGEAVASAAREEHPSPAPSPAGTPSSEERHGAGSPSPDRHPEPTHRPSPRPSPSHTPDRDDRSARPSASPTPVPSHRPEPTRSPESD